MTSYSWHYVSQGDSITFCNRPKEVRIVAERNILWLNYKQTFLQLIRASANLDRLLTVARNFQLIISKISIKLFQHFELLSGPIVRPCAAN